MRLKLYQATTQPAALKEIDEEIYNTKVNIKKIGMKKRKNESIDQSSNNNNTNAIVNINNNSNNNDRKRISEAQIKKNNI